jgi:hypothetical protein
MGTCDGSGAIFGEWHEHIEALVTVEADIVIKRHTLILSLFGLSRSLEIWETRGAWSEGSLLTPVDLPVVQGIS